VIEVPLALLTTPGVPALIVTSLEPLDPSHVRNSPSLPRTFASLPNAMTSGGPPDAHLARDWRKPGACQSPRLLPVHSIKLFAILGDQRVKI
jgi:hypothetical protein